MAWLTGWSYRKSHTINYAAGAGANSQIRDVVGNKTDTTGGDSLRVMLSSDLPIRKIVRACKITGVSMLGVGGDVSDYREYIVMLQED